MSLRSPIENENGGIFLHGVHSSNRHSHARGNPGLLSRISLDTRSPIKVGDKLRGYDGPQRASPFSSRTGIFEEGPEEHEGRMQLKVYRKDNRKKDLGRWRRYSIRCGMLAGFVILGVLLYRLSGPMLIAAASLREFVVESRYFSVREIQVRGGNKVSGNEIVTIAGLSKGMNIWKIDPAGIEQKIAKHPWVRRVLLHREFPGRISIDVEERTPRAIVAIGKLYYVDADGVIFTEVKAGDKMNYPMLTGLSAEQLSASDPQLRRRIQEAMRLGELMAQRSHALSEIHFDRGDQLIVYTAQRAMALRMGWGDWEDKLARVERLLELWKGNEARLASLDVSFRDQIVARLRRVEN